MIVSKADRLQNVEEYYFSKKLEQIQVMRSQGIDVINLGIGSPDMAPPLSARKVASEFILQESGHGYSSYRSTPELRQAMSEWMKKTYSVELKPQNEILPLLGSKEGILYLSMALLNHGDNVLIPNPGYPAYSSAASLIGAKAIMYDLKEENGWLPDLEQLQTMDLSKTKLMWVNYPHMPTGTSANKAFFEKLVAFARKNKILICNDNPYGLVLNQTRPLSLLSVDPQMEVSAELNSLSKSLNMAGWRVGMFMSSGELVDAVVKVKSNVDSGMFLAVQKAAIEALKVDQSWHDERNSIYRKRRELIWEIFDLLRFKYSRDQVGLFVWAKAPDSTKSVVDYVDSLLVEAHVFLTPGIIFGSNGDRYGRASLCASEEQLLEARRRIKEYVK
jgi:LL-diaminopimelate aminotransferase